MKQRWSVVALGVVLGLTAAGAQSQYEAPAVLRAADVVPAELLQSSVYTIDERVPTDGLVATRTFHSPLGEFLAEGPGMTAVRAEEIQALDVLTKTESSVLGEIADGTVVVPAAVDYVSWTERVANFANRPDLVGAKARHLRLAGKLSPRTRQELLARKWIVEEGVSIIPPSTPAAPRS